MRSTLISLSLRFASHTSMGGHQLKGLCARASATTDRAKSNARGPHPQVASHRRDNLAIDQQNSLHLRVGTVLLVAKFTQFKQIFRASLTPVVPLERNSGVSQHHSTGGRE